MLVYLQIPLPWVVVCCLCVDLLTCSCYSAFESRDRFGASAPNLKGSDQRSRKKTHVFRFPTWWIWGGKGPFSWKTLSKCHEPRSGLKGVYYTSTALFSRLATRCLSRIAEIMGDMDKECVVIGYFAGRVTSESKALGDLAR